jgi:hypothetical protein
MARLEGRNMTMVLSPEKKAAAKKPTNKPAAPAPAPQAEEVPAPAAE